MTMKSKNDQKKKRTSKKSRMRGVLFATKTSREHVPCQTTSSSALNFLVI